MVPALAILGQCLTQQQLTPSIVPGRLELRLPVFVCNCLVSCLGFREVLDNDDDELRSIRVLCLS